MKSDAAEALTSEARRAARKAGGIFVPVAGQPSGRRNGRLSSRKNRYYSVDGGNLTPEQVEFGKAMEEYKRLHGPFPTYSEILEVIVGLGYRKA